MRFKDLDTMDDMIRLLKTPHEKTIKLILKFKNEKYKDFKYDLDSLADAIVMLIFTLDTYMLVLYICRFVGVATVYESPSTARGYGYGTGFPSQDRIIWGSTAAIGDTGNAEDEESAVFLADLLRGFCDSARPGAILFSGLIEP